MLRPIVCAVAVLAEKKERGGRGRATPAALKSLGEQVQAWSGAAAVERLNLDGLLALWHPSSAN